MHCQAFIFPCTSQLDSWVYGQGMDNKLTFRDKIVYLETHTFNQLISYLVRR